MSAAVLLLALFCYPLISPLLLASDGDSRLPACCRRSGAHRCAVTTAVSSSGPALYAAPCRSFPGPQALPMPAGAGPAVTFDASSGLVSRKSPLLTALNERRRASFDRSHQKRGPPILLF